MGSSDESAVTPIGVGAVGVLPGVRDGILADLPEGDKFEFVAFSDEGLGTPFPDERPVRLCRDYNVLLQDPAVELVLVDGPVEKRRDSAVRALNAGKHVVVAAPFCESAPDARRIMKTAQQTGRLATMDLPWRRDADLRAVRAAMQVQGGAEVQGVFCHLPLEAPAADGGPLAQHGLAMLDGMRLVMGMDVRSVSAHVQRRGTDGPESGFLIYMPLRNGGWAIGQASLLTPAEVSRWQVQTAHAAFASAGGRALAVGTAGETDAHEAPAEVDDFWDNVHAVVRHDAAPLYHPAEIARAMNLHEAALESAELGEPVAL